MSTFYVERRENASDLDYLEEVYKKVRLYEYVKFNGKAYQRIRPVKNKHMTHPYHFYLAVKDIYKGNILSRDMDGEFVNSRCHHKLEIIGNTGDKT